MPRVWRWALALLLCLTASACGGADGDPGSEGGSTSSETSRASGSAPAGDPVADLAARCLSLMPDGADITPVSLADEDGSVIPAAVVRPSGPGRPSGTAAVLLPQTSRSGLCGWLPFAAALAERGVVSVAMDLCGYGQARCSDALTGDIVGQVALGLGRAREEGGTDLVLAGASMGGSQTVRAVAGGADVARWVDLSGPATWDDARLLDVADRVDRPGLVVYARSESSGEYAAARRLARRTGARFVSVAGGHGWDFLMRLDRRGPSRLGERIGAFIGGRQSG